MIHPQLAQLGLGGFVGLMSKKLRIAMAPPDLLMFQERFTTAVQRHQYPV